MGLYLSESSAGTTSSKAAASETSSAEATSTAESAPERADDRRKTAEPRTVVPRFVMGAMHGVSAVGAPECFVVVLYAVEAVCAYLGADTGHGGFPAARTSVPPASDEP